MVLQAIRDHMTASFPDLHVSLFVSEAGFRRGLAISRSELPKTFVLLSTDDNSLDEEQAEMTKDALFLYLGVDGQEHRPCMDVVFPNSTLDSDWMVVLDSLMPTFHLRFSVEQTD